MRARTPNEQLHFDPEIERKTSRNNRKTRNLLAKQIKEQEGTSTSVSSTSSLPKNNMVEVVIIIIIINDNNNNGTRAPGMPCHNSPRWLAHISRPLNINRQTKMKTRLLQIIYVNPFVGLDHEDPYTHLTKFYELFGTLGAFEAEAEVVLMRLFPHYIIGKAKDWYLDQPVQVMIDWNELEENLLNRFFPHNKFMDANTTIDVSSQGSNETLCVAWGRYKSMMWKCPNHGFEDLTHIYIFRNGIQPQPKLLLHATACGSSMSKSTEDAITIID